MASMTDGRFVLGLGTSGPQVIEGWHGVPFNPAYTRLRETVEILRLAMSGERLAYEGKVYRLPLPDSEGRALRTSAPPRRVPIYLATLGPRSLRMTGELADGWIASSFMAEHSAVFLDEIRAGAEAAGRPFDEIERQAGGVVEFGDDLDALIQPRKPGFAFEMGAMGSPEHNFYRDAYVRQGYSGVTQERAPSLARPPPRRSSSAHPRRPRDQVQPARDGRDGEGANQGVSRRWHHLTACLARR